jgi:hypothetical protein
MLTRTEVWGRASGGTKSERTGSERRARRRGVRRHEGCGGFNHEVTMFDEVVNLDSL